MEDLEAQANKARRKTEDPDKLMEQLQLIQKKQKELMQMQLDLQVWTRTFFDLVNTISIEKVLSYTLNVILYLQDKLMRAQGKKAKAVPSIAHSGPLKATHAPTPSKRWRAQQSTETERQER